MDICGHFIRRRYVIKNINKTELKTQLIISIISLLLIIVITILMLLPHHCIIWMFDSKGFNPEYILTIVFNIILIACYIINFIIGFIIDSKQNKLLISIKISSWLFLTSAVNWIFILWFFKIYKDKKDDDIKNDFNLMNKLKRDLLLLIFFCSIISIILLSTGELRRVCRISTLSLTLIYFSLNIWSICLISTISYIVLYKWNKNNKIGFSFILFILPELSPFFFLVKNKTLNTDQ